MQTPRKSAPSRPPPLPGRDGQRRRRGGGGGQRGVCVAGVAGGPSEGIKRWRTKAGEGKHSRRAGLEQRGKEGADRQSVASDFRRIPGCVCGQSEPGLLNLTGWVWNSGAGPEQRSRCCCHTGQGSQFPVSSVLTRCRPWTQTEPIPFRVKVSKVTVVTPPIPDP